MATATVYDINTTVIPDDATWWASVRARLSRWGAKIKGVAVRAGNFIKRSASWLWNLAPVQWVATKVGNVLRGPVGWVVGGLGALVIAPKAVGLMALATLILVVVLVGMGISLIRRSKRQLREDPIAWEARMERERAQMNESFDRHLQQMREERMAELDEDFVFEAPEHVETTTTKDTNGLITAVDDETLRPDETLGERYTYLNELLTDAYEVKDSALASELTGRIFVIRTRNGSVKRIKANSPVSEIHREARRQSEGDKVASSKIAWDWRRMWGAVQAEDARLKRIAQLKKEQANA